MYENFFQLDSDPFRLSPDHRFGFAHSSFGKARAYLKFALHRAEGFVMITGIPGSGKTTLINELLDDLSQAEVRVAMVSISQLDADDLLRTVAFSFGLTGASGDKATIIHELTGFLTNNYKVGRRALLIVDEAQDLTVSAMEELRLLTNLQIDSQPLLQIFLLGQDELRDLMQDPTMVQCHQRIVAASHLETLSEEETGDYIMHRLRSAGWSGKPLISTTVFPIIHQYSHGVPRTINQICSRLFLHAYVEQLQKIGVREISAVLSALQEEHLVPSDSLVHPAVTDGAFNDLEDNFPKEMIPPPEAESELEPDPEPVNEISAPPATLQLTPEAPETAIPQVTEALPGTEADVTIEAEPEESPAAVEAEHPVVETEHPVPGNVEVFSIPEQELELDPDDHGTAESGNPLRIAGLALVGVFALGGALYLYETAYLNPVQVALEVDGQAPGSPPDPAPAGPLAEQVAQVDYSPVEDSLELDLEALPATSAGSPVVDTNATQAPDEPLQVAAVYSPDQPITESARVVTSPDEEFIATQPETLQVLFAYRSMEIPPEFEVLLDTIAEELKDSPSSVARVIGVVENRGQAPSEVNLRVSDARAKIVRNYLVERGIAAERLTVDVDTGLLENRQGGERPPQRVVEVTVL